MKALCTSYTQTDKGLVLRNNWVDSLEEEYLEDFISKFIDDKSLLEYIVKSTLVRLKNQGYSNIIEGEMDLDGVVIHIRIVS